MEVKKIPKVLIIVLNWNSAAAASRCVQLLRCLDYKNYEIVLIDNKSTDDSFDCLSARFPDLQCIQTGKNLGYAGGNNLGIRLAIAAGADYIWILNPDVCVESESLKVMIHEMELNPSLGIAGPVIIEYDKQKEGSDRVFGWKIKEKDGWRGEKNFDSAQSRYVDYVYGCSLLVKRQVFLDVGLFREEFFMYSEEKEFCLRAKKKKWVIRIIESAQNTHYHYGENPAGAYYTCRNEIFISRIERKRRLATLKYYLNIKPFCDFLFQGMIREAFFQLKKGLTNNGAAILVGFFKSLSRPPMLEIV